MKLDVWMSITSTSDEMLALSLGIDRSHANRLRRGVKRPSTELMGKIAEATKGAVTPNDFFTFPVSIDGVGFNPDRAARRQIKSTSAA